MDGIYILADDSMEDMAIACLNSLRTVEPCLPICFIPFQANGNRMRSLARSYGIAVWDDEIMLDACDEISLLFHHRAMGHYRKLAAWFGPFDRFLYVDVDTLFFQPLRHCFQLLDQHDIITAVSHLPAILQFVWKNASQLSDVGIDASYAANTGLILSKTGLFSQQQIHDLAVASLRFKDNMALECIEQPLLNYIFTTSGVRYTSISQLRKHDKTMPAELWGGRWSGRMLDLKELPLLVHWAGVWRAHKYLLSPAWQHFRHLSPPVIAHNHFLDKY